MEAGDRSETALSGADKPRHDKQEGVAELWHKTRAMKPFLVDAKNSKLFTALEKKAREKAMALMRSPQLQELTTAPPASPSKHGSSALFGKRKTIFRVNVDYFHENFFEKTLPTSRLRQRQTLWLILVHLMSRVSHTHRGTVAEKIRRQQLDAVIKITRVWKAYRRIRRSAVEQRARRRWRRGGIAVMFALAISTCQEKRLTAASILTAFLQMAKTSTPRKLVHRYLYRIRCAQRLWREYRLTTLARLLWLSRLWVDTEKEMLHELHTTHWRNSLSLLYHAAKSANGIPMTQTDEVAAGEKLRREIIVNQRFQLVVKKSTLSTDINKKILAAVASTRRTAPSPFTFDTVEDITLRLIHDVAPLLKPDMIMARNKETKTLLNIGLVPPALHEGVRFVILRQYLMHKRLAYKKRLVVRAQETREQRIKRLLCLNEDDMRVMLRVSTPQAKGLVEELFYQAMLPTTGTVVRPMNLIRRTKMSEIRTMIKACIVSLQQYYSLQVQQVASAENRASILTQVSASLQKSASRRKLRPSIHGNKNADDDTTRPSTAPEPIHRARQSQAQRPGTAVARPTQAEPQRQVLVVHQDPPDGDSHSPVNAAEYDFEYVPSYSAEEETEDDGAAGEVLGTQFRIPTIEARVEQPFQPEEYSLSPLFAGHTRSGNVSPWSSGHSPKQQEDMRVQREEKRTLPLLSKPSEKSRSKSPPKHKKTHRSKTSKRKKASKGAKPMHKHGSKKKPLRSYASSPSFPSQQSLFARSFRNKMKELELRMGPQPRSPAKSSPLKRDNAARGPPPTPVSHVHGFRERAPVCQRVRPSSSPGVRKSYSPTYTPPVLRFPPYSGRSSSPSSYAPRDLWQWQPSLKAPMAS